MTSETEILSLLSRIANALERTAPPAPAHADFSGADAFVWSAEGGGRFQPVPQVNRVPLGLLKGIDHTASILLENTRRFASGLPANNALLWGARGMGKSSLVKAAHAEAGSLVAPSDTRSARRPQGAPQESGRLILVEIHREDIASLPSCLTHLKASPHRFIVFCPRGTSE